MIKIIHSFNWFSILRGGGTSDLMFKLVKSQEKNPKLLPGIITSDESLDTNLVSQLTNTDFIITKTFKKIFNINLYISSYKSLLSFKPDIIHMHVYRSVQNIFLYTYCFITKTPYIMDAHGSVPYWNKNKLKKIIFDFVIGKRIMLGASAWIAETEIGKKEYTDFFPEIRNEQIDVLSPPFGVDEFIDLPETSDDEFRIIYNLPNNAKIITFLGRLHEGKGNDFLLKGIANLRKKNKNIYCMLVGADDGHESTLRDLAKDLNIEEYIIFTGFKSGNKKNEILKCSNIVVQLSRFEQGAWAPLEGVLCETPIIVTDHTGTGEDIRRLDAGYLVEIDNISDLSNKIEYILQNPNEALKKTKITKDYIIKNLSMDARMDEYISIYERCII